MRIKIFVILLLATLFACENLPKTKSGVEMKFVRAGNGVNPNHGEVISLNMEYLSDDGKVKFDTRTVGAPVQITFDTSDWKTGGMLYEVLELLEVGDSVQFEIPAENLYEVSFQQKLPDSVKRGTKVKFNLGLERSATLEVMKAERIAKRAKTEERILDNFLAREGVDFERTDSGLRYVIHRKGNGPLPKTGEIITVHYKASLLDKLTFYSTPEGQPYSFHLGYGRVIKGWDEAFALLHEGTEATLYVPSSLAYGELGSGKNIPPNSIIIFEVEFISIMPPKTNG